MRALSETGLLALFPVTSDPAPGLCTVNEVMAPDVISVQADTSLQTVGELMLEHGISGVPVVDAHGRLVGLVSKTDLIRHQLGEEGVEVPLLGQGQHVLDGATAGDVMTRDVVTVNVGAPLSEAAEAMALAGVHRVPVVGAGRTLMGLVSSSDIVRWVAGLP